MYRILCHCGQESSIRGSQAGSQVTCDCGRVNLVPPLSELKNAELQNEPSHPLSSISPTSNGRADDESAFKPAIRFHFGCGNVSREGSVTSWAMNHYVDLLHDRMREALWPAEQLSFSELVLSIALGPNNQKRIEFDIFPKESEFVEQEQILKLLNEVATPLIHKSPIAFVLLIQAKYVGDIERSLSMFPSLKNVIQSHGMETAIRNAFANEPATATEEVEHKPQPLSWWQRFFTRSKPRDVADTPVTEEPIVDELFLQQQQWLENSELLADQHSLTELKKLITGYPNDFRFQVAYAEKNRRNKAWASAIEWYDKLIEWTASYAPLLGRRAEVHQFAGNLEAALRDYSSAIELAPHYALYRIERSQIYCELAAWKEAKKDMDEAIRLAPIDPVAFFQRARILLQQDQLADAIDDFKEALRLDPHFGYVHYQLGWLFSNQFSDKGAEAIKHLNRAIELTQDSTNIRVCRSLTYLAQNKFELALEDCDYLLRINPINAEVLGIRGRVLQCDGRYEEAIAACTKSIEHGYEHPLVYLARAISFASTDQTSLAVVDCDSALALDPNNVWVIQCRGRLQLQSGDLDAAMKAFNRARELAPDWIEPREHLSLVHRMKENPQAAVEEQTLLVEQYPNQASNYVNRAFAYTQMHAYREAAEDYGRAIEIEPENEKLYNLRGLFRMQCQDKALALADFEQVLSLAGEDDNARACRGMLLLDSRRFQEAVDDFTQLISKYPDNANAYSGRAIAFAGLGNAERADADIDRLIEIAPETAEEVQQQTRAAVLYNLVRSEDYDAALNCAEQIVADYPSQSIGYRLRAHVYWEREEYVEAADDYSHVLQLDGPKADCLSSRGQVMAELGEYDQALADLDQAVGMARDAGQNIVLAYALNGRSLTLSALNRDDESTRDFEESVKLRPTNPWVYYHRGMAKFRSNQLSDAKTMLDLALELKEPPLSKRKRLRAKAALEKIANFDTPC